MNILIPVTDFGKAGGYRVLSKLADEFIKLGHKVDFITTEESAHPYYPTHANILYLDKKGNVAKQNNFQKEQSLFRNIIRLYMFLKKIKRGQYDLVLANQSMTPFPVLFSMVSAKCVYYIQAYEPALYRQFDGKKYLLLSVLSKLSYSLPFTKIVNSPLLLNYKGIKTNNMALPGIDLDNFSPNKNYVTI